MVQCITLVDFSNSFTKYILIEIQTYSNIPIVSFSEFPYACTCICTTVQAPVSIPVLVDLWLRFLSIVKFTSGLNVYCFSNIFDICWNRLINLRSLTIQSEFYMIYLFFIHLAWLMLRFVLAHSIPKIISFSRMLL